MSVSEVERDYHFDLSQRRSPVGGFMKRTMDVTIAGLVLLFLSPVFVLISLMIMIRDPGPIFFGHERIGYGGRKFRCLKFRSMVMNSSEVLANLLAEDPEARAEWNENQKLRNDPRITTLGKILRETSLDELPQLLNVIRGEMSLVGPRPIVSAEVERYASDIRSYNRARPGITGLWQVSGRSNCSYERRVKYDVEYVRRWSPALDTKILFQTVSVVLKREGSC